MEDDGPEKQSSLRLCFKSKKCSQVNGHRGKCNHEGRDLGQFWKHSSRQKLQGEKRNLKDKFDSLLEQESSCNAKAIRLEEQEEEIRKKKDEADELFEAAHVKKKKIEENIDDKSKRLDELTAQYNKRKSLFDQKQQSKARRLNLPTNLEMINTFSSSTRYRRRQETKDMLEFIHGGQEASIYGAWDYLSSVVSPDLLDKLISNYKRGTYLQGMFGRALDNYKNSEEALKQATSIKYQNFMSRRKFKFFSKTQSSYFDPDKELWVPRNIKHLGVDIKLMHHVSDNAVERFVKSLNIGHICQIPNVSGLCRTVTGLIFMILDLHLRLPHLKRKLVWLNGNTNHFIFQFSDDGAPETSQLSMSIGSLTCWNFWSRVRSRDYHYILHCLSIGEKDKVMSDLWNQISQEMQMLEGNVVVICGQQCTLEFQPSADQSWQSWAANELNQAATYPSPYANVNKSDLEKIGGSIGSSDSDTWQPYTMEKRTESLNKVSKYMTSLSSGLAESTKHAKMLDFMAENGIRQLGPPRIGIFADRMRPEPLHVEINAWQHYLNLLYHEALQRSMIDVFLDTLSAPTSVKVQTKQCCEKKSTFIQDQGVGARVANVTLVKQQASSLDQVMANQSSVTTPGEDIWTGGCGLPFLAKKVREHYCEENKRHNNLSTRLIGQQAILLAQYSYRIVDSLYLPDESKAESKESKHAAIKQDLDLTNRSTAADISDVYEIEESARQGLMLSSVVDIFKPFICKYCPERFPDDHELNKHHNKFHEQQLVDCTPKLMTVPQLKDELKKRGLSTTAMTNVQFLFLTLNVEWI
ncbi:hypothetical protein AC249_AIPGENE25365 [Exaiptasia diaphana]|nr:hypothetical protein AC249_AIPGENE25365 [Exaiptasia diaphana]